MSHNQHLPKMEDFPLEEMRRPLRVGIYAEVYERLLAGRRADPPMGVRVSFPSLGAGSCAIKKMNQWASEDGFYIEYGRYERGARKLALMPIEPEESK